MLKQDNYPKYKSGSKQVSLGLPVMKAVLMIWFMGYKGTEY